MKTKSSIASFSGLQTQHKKRNWPLLIGAILVSFMAVLAIFGPSFAQQDPMKENYALKVKIRFAYRPIQHLKSRAIRLALTVMAATC